MDNRISVDHLLGLISAVSSCQKYITQTALDLQALALSKKREIKTQLDLSDDLAEVLKHMVERLGEIVPPFVWCEMEEHAAIEDKEKAD